MLNEPRRIFLFAGFIVSTIAIAAYVAQAGRPWLPTDEFGSARGDAPAYRARSDVMSGAVITAPLTASGNSSSSKAAGNSLQRNDPAAAQARLEAPRSDHQNNGQAHVLQQEMQARKDGEEHLAAATQSEKAPQAASKPVRILSSGAKHGRSRGGSHHASIDASSRRALDNLMARLGRSSAGHARTPVGTASATVDRPSSIRAGAKTARSATNASVAAPAVARAAQEPPTSLTAAAPSAEPKAELTAQTALSPSSAMQSDLSGGAVVKTDGGPKTRAQVRAEIARARQNGSLPRFGNPDPAGPGGAPSFTPMPRP